MRNYLTLVFCSVSSACLDGNVSFEEQNESEASTVNSDSPSESMDGSSSDSENESSSEEESGAPSEGESSMDSEDSSTSETVTSNGSSDSDDDTENESSTTEYDDENDSESESEGGENQEPREPLDETLGCADGQREGFIDSVVYPEIAGCSGAWSVPGVLHFEDPACERKAGDDGNKDRGEGCNVEDLCSDGWHVCEGADDVEMHNPTGCRGATRPGDDLMFFATRQSGAGFQECGSEGSAEVFGCGNYGNDEDVGENCRPLHRRSGEQCLNLASPWDCDRNIFKEAESIHKKGPAWGGVLCCLD